MKEVTELMSGSFESTEVSAAVKEGAISSFSVLASDVESYSPNCLPPSVMSLNKLASLSQSIQAHAYPLVLTNFFRAPHWTS